MRRCRRLRPPRMMDLAQYKVERLTPGRLGIERERGQALSAIGARQKDVDQRGCRGKCDVGRTEAHPFVGELDRLEEYRIVQPDDLKERRICRERPPGENDVA